MIGRKVWTKVQRPTGASRFLEEQAEESCPDYCSDMSDCGLYFSETSFHGSLDPTICAPNGGSYCSDCTACDGCQGCYPQNGYKTPAGNISSLEPLFDLAYDTRYYLIYKTAEIWPKFETMCLSDTFITHCVYD
jgi:hypothetical protein